MVVCDPAFRADTGPSFDVKCLKVHLCLQSLPSPSVSTTSPYCALQQPWISCREHLHAQVEVKVIYFYSQRNEAGHHYRLCFSEKLT